MRNLNWRVLGVVALFGAGLLISGLLRFYNLRSETPLPLSDYSTVVYVGVTVLAAILLSRLGVPLQGLGFGPAFQPTRFLLLAATGVGLIQLFGQVLVPLSEQLFGLVHAYQGPAGILGSSVNGLVFGAITLAGRGSIWPAALAHGASNSIGILQLYLSG